MAVQLGCLRQEERQQLDNQLQDLFSKPLEMQHAVVGKFLGLGMGLRGVADKGSWLERCIQFCESSDAEASEPSAISAAFAVHALPISALPMGSWETYVMLAEVLQNRVAEAVRSSILANVQGDLAAHFANVCRNELAIYALQARPQPRVQRAPEQLDSDALKETCYHRLLLQLHSRDRNNEEHVLQELAAVPEDVTPGSPGSLLYLHTASTEARRAGPADASSPLHAAASSGLPRVCARLLAEGFHLNERSGSQEMTPLHLAASRGVVEVVELLLSKHADANSLDAEGCSPLYLAVREAARLQEPQDEPPTTHRSLLLKVSRLLLVAGAANVPQGVSNPRTPEALAQEHQLVDFRNLIRLHIRARGIGEKVVLDGMALSELCKLQYETAMFFVALFERHVSVSAEAAPSEFRALIGSSFIQSRDLVQRKGNVLAKRLGISKKAIKTLVDMPPPAGLYALQTWKVEEVAPNVYEVPDHLNAAPPPPPPPPPPLEGSGEASPDADAAAGPLAQAALAHGTAKEDLPPKLEGRVRKWDSERGFGFITQDSPAGIDIFVHRTNIVASTPNNHLDLIDNYRISYRVGEQDGRNRALEATMLDEDGKILPMHLDGSSLADEKAALEADLNLEPDGQEHQITYKFLRHLRSPQVQRHARETRGEIEAWLRCIGIRRQSSGRRDEVVWKKEIEQRIDLFLDRKKTPLQKRDFDFRVRRFLMEFCLRSSVTRVTEALAMVETSTSGKMRNDVRSWPAYLATLLRRFDPKLYEILANRDMRSRVDQKGGAEGGDYYEGGPPSERLTGNGTTDDRSDAGDSSGGAGANGNNGGGGGGSSGASTPREGRTTADAGSAGFAMPFQ